MIPCLGLTKVIPRCDIIDRFIGFPMGGDKRLYLVFMKRFL